MQRNADAGRKEPKAYWSSRKAQSFTRVITQVALEYCIQEWHWNTLSLKEISMKTDSLSRILELLTTMNLKHIGA